MSITEIGILVGLGILMLGSIGAYFFAKAASEETQKNDIF